MKIYTKTGDSGSTGLFGGKRIPKSHQRIKAYGEIDELNSVIGIAAATARHEPLRKSLVEIQNTLFTLGAQLASPGTNSAAEVITSAHTNFLERQIDTISPSLPPLKNFILPGGTTSSAYLHLARTVCRRAEREIVSLNEQSGEEVDSWVLIYVNRLSDLLFVLARLANQLEGISDTVWAPSKL